MGTRMAPPYANLFMGKFEQEFLQTFNRLSVVEVYQRCIRHLDTWGAMSKHILTGVE